VLVPVALPAGLDLEVVVGHILLYPVVDLLRRLCVRVSLVRRRDVSGTHLLNRSRPGAPDC
jgi:hypothetical protein